MPQVAHVIVIVLLVALILPIAISMIANNPMPTGEATVYHYDIDTQNGDNEIDNDDFAVAEYVSNSSSVLVGDNVNCIDLAIARTVNSNLTGNAIIGVFDSLGVATDIWATVDVGDFDDDPDNPLFYTYCFADYIIQSGDRIGIRYDLAGEDDNLIVFNLDPAFFDSEFTRVNTFDTINWVEEGAEQDLTMRLYDAGVTDSNAEMINQLFIAFILLLIVLVLIMLIRAIFSARD